MCAHGCTEHPDRGSNGLGELRAWTMNGAIQDSMPIYLDQPTHSEVKQVRPVAKATLTSKCFPYLVNTQSSTAAAVAELDFQVFDRSKPFQLCGVTIVPFDGALRAHVLC